MMVNCFIGPDVQGLLFNRQALKKQGSPMAALARIMSRAIGIEIEVDALRPVLICRSDLLLSLVLMIHGCDLSVGL